MSDVTIQDVARAASVSTASVSNFLNGRHDRMRPETRDRILSVIKDLDYKPSGVARQLKSGQAPMIGLLVPTVANPFFGELAVAVERSAQAQGFHVLLCNTLRDLKREREFANELVAYGVRGLISASALTDLDEVNSLIRRGVSLVFFDVQSLDVGGMGVDVVTLDNAGASRLAVNHLVGLGHRRIAYVTAPTGTISRSARLRGYREEIRANALDFELVVIEEARKRDGAYGDTDLAELGRRAATRIATSTPRPTAVVAMNDMIALGLISGLRDAGLNVPHDISIVGIDDINVASLLSPSLTTIRQPFAEMAEAAVGGLKKRMALPTQSGSEHVFAPELIVRASTASPTL
ncbi:LacI family DNA-binding transcriptional regulator [Bosea sp. 117]|uniref:LacI family DNA-binding transcriptional regulator n=1 Tax=Bosea sp. 117 TaxID=1125973 RepID=UPI000493BFA0|nr:LacI family DNA-binding transcriptional regulator [Bosea sp. 117]